MNSQFPWHSIMVGPHEDSAVAKLLVPILTLIIPNSCPVVLINDVAEVFSRLRETSHLLFPRHLLIVPTDNCNNENVVSFIHQLRNATPTPFEGGLIFFVRDRKQMILLERQSLFGLPDQESTFAFIPGHKVLTQPILLAKLVQCISNIGFIAHDKWNDRVKQNRLFAERENIVKVLELENKVQDLACWTRIIRLLDPSLPLTILPHGRAREVAEKMTVVSSTNPNSVAEVRSSLESILQIIDTCTGKEIQDEILRLYYRR